VIKIYQILKKHYHNKKHKLLLDNKGISLIEIIIALAIFGMIILPFFSIFVLAAKSNHSTNEITDKTYLAQDCMEDLLYLASEPATQKLDDTRDELITPAYGYTESGDASGYIYEKIDSLINAFIRIEISPSGSLYKVIVRIYPDSTSLKPDVQMETLISWK